MTDTNEIRHIINQRIEEYQRLLNDVDLYESLRVIDRDFMLELDWLRDEWLNDQSDELFDAKRVGNIEDVLVNLPFEQAMMHKDQSLRTLSLHDILVSKFGEDVAWRTKPEIIMGASRTDKLRIHTYFEYMCYFVLNVREELLFDICSRLGLTVK